MSETEPAPQASPAPSRNPVVSRSRGTKLIVVCVLAVLMAIPAVLVWGLLLERTHRAQSVADEIGGLVGGSQTFLGPVVGVPYVVPAHSVVDDTGKSSLVAASGGELVVFPVTGKVDATTKSEVRSRSLFRVPVYTADMMFNAHFDFSAVQGQAPAGAVLLWEHAELLTGASDSRGAHSDIVARLGGNDVILAPAKEGRQDFNGGDNGSVSLDMFAAPASGLTPEKPLDVGVHMNFSGAQRIAFLAFAKSTEANVSGD